MTVGARVCLGCALGHSGSRWVTLGHSGSLWVTLGHACALGCALGHSLTSLHANVYGGECLRGSHYRARCFGSKRRLWADPTHGMVVRDGNGATRGRYKVLVQPTVEFPVCPGVLFL
eukprot:1196165-Prorocentrum_minimum.AAC.5